MKAIFENKNLIGSDETGVGDYLTPLVAAAVYVSAVNVSRLQALGVKDSKKLSDVRINQIFNQIVPYIQYSIRSLSQEEYNRLQEHHNYNAHELKTLLHFKAINALEQREKNVDAIIVDKYADEKNMAKYFANLITNNESVSALLAQVHFLERAEEEHVAVAAASIVARRHLLELMKQQEQKWKMVFPLGTNEIVENTARFFVNKYSKTELPKVAKMSFKTTKKVI